MQTTDQGLPSAVRIERAELQRDPVALARDILRLCSLSADIAGMQRRELLAREGISRDVIEGMGLPTAQDVARRELQDEWDSDTETSSWMRWA